MDNKSMLSYYSKSTVTKKSGQPPSRQKPAKKPSQFANTASNQINTTLVSGVGGQGSANPANRSEVGDGHLSSTSKLHSSTMDKSQGNNNFERSSLHNQSIISGKTGVSKRS
jgi:hypothetical protein